MTAEDGSGHGVRGGATGLTGFDAEMVTEYFERMVDDLYALTLRDMVMGGAAPHDAEDAVQQAFTEAWVALRDHGPSTIQHPRAWLLKVAMRKHLRPPGLRRKVLMVTMPELPETKPLDLDPANFSVLTLSMRRGFARLSDRQRVIVLLRIQGLTYREINKELGGPDTLAACEQIKNEWRKAKSVLWDELRDHDEGEEGR